MTGADGGPGSGPAPHADGDAVLACAREVAGALHPHLREPGRVTLDSRLDGDLGLDSLSRAELVARVEGRFGVSLPERLLATAETPRDLLRAVGGAPARRGIPASPVVPARAAGPPADGSEPREPVAARTLVDVVEWHAHHTPERLHMRLLEEADGGAERVVSHAALAEGARRVAGGLRARGLEAGDSVAIMLPTSVEYFECFLGVLLAGGVPVPIYPPARIAQLEDHFRRHARILDNAQARMLVTFREARAVARLLTTLVEGLALVCTPPELAAHDALADIARPQPDATAFLQYTSGSTGNPKGVVLTHANLLANIRAMGRVLGATPGDVFVSWLPLYHDMGLIGAWMGSLYYGMSYVVMSPLAFLARPARWLQAITRHGGTLSGGPNFAYELCLRRIDEAELGTIDLSSWRYAFNGAEPVSAETVESFARRFARCGLRREAIAPVYGLAEASLGIAFPPPGRQPLVDHIRRDVLARAGRAEPARAGDADALSVVACGQPLPGYQVRIVDESGHEAGEREEGRLQFRGPSTTSGYHRNPEATRALFQDGWLESGDRAYIAGGDVFLTGRVKDVIIRAGRNIYPYELEEAVGDLEGVRRGCVAVFAAAAPAGGAERLVVVAETRERESAALTRLRDAITAQATRIVDVAPDDVVLAPPHSVLKTSSGKIRRLATRELYEAGRLGGGRRAVWLQVLRLALAGMVPGWRESRRRVGHILHAVRVWSLCCVVIPPVFALLQMLPGARRRWKLAARAVRLLLRGSGIALSVDGAQNISRSGACVIVANHQSYLDGIVLTAALGRPASFVAKGELARSFVVRRMLVPLGVRFVQRFDAVRGLEDARVLGAALGAGEALVFFPEGTLRRMPGLMPFRMGAFVTAVEGGAPVVPVAIRGTRSVLRDGSLFPRRGMVQVHIGEPVASTARAGTTWERALLLRADVRRHMLDACGEPDLSGYLPYAEMVPGGEGAA